jgi:hypothetical protein
MSTKEETIEEKERKIEFWGTDPNALFEPKSILELFPTSNMSYNQKLNAISRLVILLIFLIYFITRSLRVFVIGLLTLGAIWMLNYSQTKNAKKVRFKESFNSELGKAYLRDKTLPTDIFAESTFENPFQNVLFTDYDNAAEKKPAPAAYDPQVQQDVMTHTKTMIDKMNPEQPKISEKLFHSLEDNLAFEQSLRPFYSNPATTIPNDQSSFADFCFGSMVSCKEGNPFACTKGNLGSP